eukprot:8682186-Pyramimonas_sp.AAC.1
MGLGGEMCQNKHTSCAKSGGSCKDQKDIPWAEAGGSSNSESHGPEEEETHKTNEETGGPATWSRAVQPCSCWRNILLLLLRKKEPRSRFRRAVGTPNDVLPLDPASRPAQLHDL